LKYTKYVILVLFVILLPFVLRHELSGLGAPWFCKYICPSGTIFGAIPLLAINDFLRGFTGFHFYVKISIAGVIIISSVFIYRTFCRILCPLGAFYSLFNKIAFIKINCNKIKCTSCGSCREACKIQLEPSKQPNSPECVRCGDCISSCSVRALKYNNLKPEKK